jgi:ATP-dependent DNA ligase
MNITEFVEGARAKSKGKVKAPIAQRWNERVVPRGLHNQGRNGARAYLDAYGKGIAAPKVIELAVCAEVMNAPEMAAGFWEAAFNLQTGESATFGTNGSSNGSGPTQGPIQVGKTKQEITLKGIPPDMQPGRIAPMQPKDAPAPQGDYIANPAYQGQPKRDGHKNFLFATPEETAHQSRSTSIMGMIAPEFEEAVKTTASETGPFILEGERYYLSASGSEHRTAAQAATANIAMGKGEIQPVPVYGAFKALFANGKDLREGTEDERVNALTGIVALIESHLPENGPHIEAVPTARTTEEKQALAERQIAEGREGIVWTRKDCKYTHGDHTEDTCRTKFLQEKVFTVLGITPSKAQGRILASIEVADETGKRVGSVGTGFDTHSAAELTKQHLEHPGEVKVLVRFRNYTEKGMLFESRFIETI